MTTHYRLIALTIVAAFTLMSCGGATNTQLTSAWKDENYAEGPVSTVMIVGVAQEMNTRVLFENTFADFFAQYGVEAVSSAAAMPDDSELDKDEIKAKAEELGIENVLVTHLAGTDDEDVYTTPVKAPASDRFSTYYAQVYGQTPTRETLGEREYVFLENKLYDVATEELIWSGRSTSVDPYSLNELIQDLGKAVTADLQKQGLLK
ncbi:MAG: hypothetical protein GY801_46100 [bacterium]|nr:hypothetical protein [bacterium]